MRRFRATWLRKQRTPEDIIKFWLGHAKESVTDTYSKLADDEEFLQRKLGNLCGLEWCARRDDLRTFPSHFLTATKEFEFSAGSSL
jgi:hypothetical protein